MVQQGVIMLIESRVQDPKTIPIIRPETRCSLSIPQRLVVVKADESGSIVVHNFNDLESSSKLILDKLGSLLVAFVEIFIVDSTMMFLRVLAALEHQFDQGVKLRVCVIGIVDVSG